MDQEQTKAKTAEELSVLFHTVSQNWAQCDPDADASCSEAMANINEEAYRSFYAGYRKAYFESQSHIANLEAEKTHLKRHFESDQKYIKSLEKTVADYYGFINTFIESPENVLLAKVRNLEAQNNELRVALEKIKEEALNPSDFSGRCYKMIVIIEQALKEDKKDG